MHRLRALVAAWLCVAAAGPATAASIDCSAAISTECLAAAIFSIAKTLPENESFRQRVAFAETELAPGDLKTALEFIVGEAADPPSWEGIEWIARAGRFDRAIEHARQAKSQIARLGGLLAIAALYLDKNDTARAQEIVEDVERELPAVSGADNDQEAGSLRRDAGEIRARLGQLDRAVQLIGGDDEAVSTFLAIASKYPVAASLREQAWRAADHARQLRHWTLLVEDAIGRGDQVEISRVAQRAGRAMQAATNANDPMWAIPLAQVFVTGGTPEPAAQLVRVWPEWVKGKDAISQYNTVNALMPVLVGLGRDDEVRRAASAVSDIDNRSRCLTTAAGSYFRLGRHDVGARLDAEAQKLLSSNSDTVLHNLALARARRGDVQGALAAVAKLSNEVKVRDVTSYVVRSAIESGHGPVAGPAIESLQQIATTTRNVGLLLHVTEGWLAVGNEASARKSLSQALRIRDGTHTPLTWEDAGRAAKLLWRLDGAGKAEAMIDIVDKLEASDPSTIDDLVEFMRPVSPAVAVQLSDRQTEVWRKVTGLANIAIQVAGDAR
jgi:tetratricopeptide (TPR) repeat protein